MSVECTEEVAMHEIDDPNKLNKFAIKVSRHQREKLESSVGQTNFNRISRGGTLYNLISPV